MFHFTIRDVLWLTVVAALVSDGRCEDSVDLKIVKDVAAAEVLDAANWGDLKLRFVYDGVPPQPKVIAKAFGPPLGVDETLLVNPKDQGVANVAVWLRHDSQTGKLPIHPTYAKSATDDVALTVVGDALAPRVTILRTTQNLVITNLDPHGHNIKSELWTNKGFNHFLSAGESVRLELPNSESAPARIDDSIKSWLTGFLHVRDNPYHAVSNGSGEVKITKIPKGRWTFVVWHEWAGYVKQATLGGRRVAWERGRLTLDIQPGENDFGEIKLAPDIFKR
jgi:hypothetical protein